MLQAIATPDTPAGKGRVFAIGDRVRFTFGCTDTELFGEIEQFATDRQGMPAAVIGVAGFPSWKHTEPLATLRPALVQGSVFWDAITRKQPARVDRCTGCMCDGRDAGACLGGFFGQSGC